MTKRPKSGKRANGAKRWVQLEHYLLDSPSYRALSSNARAVYTQLKRLYNGKNNGALALSTRAAADTINASNDTGARALIELQEHGFIAISEDSNFDRKVRLAREYRLTELPNDRPGEARTATKDFLNWTPPPAPEIQNTVASIGQTVRPIGQREVESARKTA